MKNKGKLKFNFLLAILSIAFVVSIVIFSNASPTGAVTLTVTQKGLGSSVSNIPLSFDQGYSKVSKIDVKARIGGTWCLAGPSVAKVYDNSNNKISEITLPKAGGGGTASATKIFALPINVKKVVVEDSGAVGTCQYIDFAEAKLYYINDAPVISEFAANPEKGVGNTFVKFTADVSDDGDPLNIKLYFDVNDIRAGTTQTSFIDTKNIESVEDAPLGGYKYSAPASGVSTYTARLEVSDGKNSPVISEKTISIYAEDKVPPVVAVSSDKQTYFTGDAVALTATATDDIGISAIEIYLDNTLVKTCPASPCLYSTSYNSPGAHTFFAKAKDLSSPANVGTSGAKSFNVLQNYILTVAKTDEGSGVVKSSPDGINCGQTCFNKFASGTSVTLTATPDYGSKFESWGGECASAGSDASCTIIMDSQKAVYAKFSAIPCTWSKQERVMDENFWGVDFINRDTGWVVGGDGIILKTIDGGKTWGIQNLYDTENWNDVNFINENVGWVISSNNGKLYKTTDGGNNWAKQYEVWGENKIYFIDSNTGWIFGGGSDRVSKTTDGGKTWTTYNNNFNIREAFFVDVKTGWAAADEKGVVKTTDGGKTWTTQYSTTKTLYDVMFVSSTTGWVVGESGKIIKTTDGGNTWIDQSIDAVGISEVYFTDLNNGWIFEGGEEDTFAIQRILKTSDGGETWVAEKMPYDKKYDVREMKFIDKNTGYAVGASGILKCSVPEQQTGGRSQSQPNVPACTDKDNDGYGAKGTNLAGCKLSSTASDCNDDSFFTNPGAGEVCNSIDDNCNGKTDDGLEAHQGIENFNGIQSYADAAGTKSKTKGVCQYALVSCTNGKWQWDYKAGASQHGWVYETTEGKASANNCNDGVDNDCDGLLDCGTLQNCSPLTWASDGERSNGYCNTFCDSLAQQTCGQVGGSQGQGQGAAGGGGYQAGGSGE